MLDLEMHKLDMKLQASFLLIHSCLDLSFTVQGSCLILFHHEFDHKVLRTADQSSVPTARSFTFGVDLKF
jgi:hypothetical protein